jgi:dihydropyrimidinase
MGAQLSIVNGRFVVPELGVISGPLVVRDGVVAELRDDGSSPSADHVIDAGGRYVLPGLIDPHVHYGMFPPLRARLRAESAYAGSGGVTTVIRYFRRPESYLETLPAQIRLGEQEQYQDFAHHLVLYTREQAVEMDAYVRELGVTSFKLYMNMRRPFGDQTMMDLLADAPDERSFADVDYEDGHLFEAFRIAANSPQRVRINVHAEEAEIVLHEVQRVRGSGLVGLAAWHAARPGMSEAIAIHKVGYLARQFDVPIYFPHIGSREAIDALADLRDWRVRFVAETGPQYVGQTIESSAGVYAKVMPPVRTAEDVERVWSGIREGLVTCLGSDHVASTLAEKEAGDIWQIRAGFGATGMTLPVFLSEGVNAGRLSVRTLAQISSYHTARAFGLYPKKGTLLPGSDADFVIIDLEKRQTVHVSNLLTMSEFDIFEGRTLQGGVVLTAVRGEIVFRDGQLVGKPGHGRYLPRGSVPGGHASQSAPETRR